jgi:hypothetical protein
MKLFTFQCSNKSDLFAVTRDPTSDKLPGGICSGGWVLRREEEVERGAHIAGFVSRDLFRDLDRKGYHLASGVRAVSSYQAGVTTSVSVALSTANLNTKFFPTDSDA